MQVNIIKKGDCIELLKSLPDDSIDLVFADPPYNLQLQGDLYRPDQSKVSAVNDDWDKFLNFKEYDKFCINWIPECKRVLKNTGTIWIIGSYHNIFRIGTILQDLGFWILNDIIWLKTNPMPNFKGTRFNNAHETLIWASKNQSSKYTFHYHSLKCMNDDLQMRSDWLIPICQGRERLKENGIKVHSTQKPEELLYRIIMSSSNQGDIILDPFFESGTTGAIAKKLNRKFIGFEKEEKYIKVAKDRIAKIIPIDSSLLEYFFTRKKPKVSFGNLIEKGFIKIGQELFSKDKKFKFRVMADSSITDGIQSGSIHKVSAMLLNKSSNNGWLYWYVKKEENLILIDKFRYEYESLFLTNKNANELFVSEKKLL